MEEMLRKLRFHAVLRDLFGLVPAHWRIRVTVWNPGTAEEWEITPVGAKQVRRATVIAEVEAV